MTTLYRTTDGRLLEKDDQKYLDPDLLKPLFIGDDGKPVDNSGKVVEGEVVTKLIYTPEEYYAAFPEGETWRNWQSDNRPGTIVLVVQTYGMNDCMPGCMYQVFATPQFDHPRDTKYSMKPRIYVNDGDDGSVEKYFDTQEQMLAGLEELKQLVPFHMFDLLDFGYEYS